MAKVTQYQQSQLASSLVGTPGVFNAGAQTLENIAGGAGQIANSVQAIGNAIFGDELARRRQAEAEARAAQREIERADRESYIADKVGQADVEYTKALTELKAQHQNNTDGAIPNFQERAKAIRDSFISQETDPLKKAELNKQLAQKGTGYINGLVGWTQERQIPIMADRLNSLAGNFSLAVSNADLSAGEVGQKYQEFVQQNLSNYQFVKGADGGTEMRKALEPAIINYLQSTALNRPELLEARIKAFSGGSMIDPSRLLAVANEQRRMANAAESLRLQDEHKSQANAQLAATSEVIAASPDGDAKNASPADLIKIQQKYGPSMSPDARNKLAKDIKEASEESKKQGVKLATVEDEKKIVSGFATHAAREEQLAGKILSSVDTMFKTKDKTLQRQLIQKNQLLIDQYQDTFTALNAVKNNITDPATKRMAELHLVAAKERFGNVVSKISNSPDGMKAKQVKDDLYGKVYPGNIFPDAKTQGIYNYFYKNVFYETLQNSNASADQMQKILGSPQALQAFRNTLAKKAHAGMVNFGVLPY